MKELPLADGLVALVDDEDFDFLNQWKWNVERRKHHDTIYAVRFVRTSGGRRIVRMHREILKPDEGLLVDHVNHDGLDNRRENLRVATQTQNMANTRHRARASGFRGVEPLPSGKFRARLKVAGRDQHVGVYSTAEDAARAYDAAVVALYGEFATPNFPA